MSNTRYPMSGRKRRPLRKFGKELRLKRRQQSLRLSDVARLTHTRPARLHEYEVGRIQDPDVEFLRQIAPIIEWKYEDMILMLIQEKYGLHFFKQDGTYGGGMLPVGRADGVRSSIS